jgi:hypothetical protein
MKHLPLSLIAATIIASGAPAKPVTVNPYNFARAETDTYMARFVKSSGLGKFEHIRTPAPIERQDVIRMNRDTIYSSAVFDLDAGPVTIMLPDAGKRFMSALVINQDHYLNNVTAKPDADGGYTIQFGGDPANTSNYLPTTPGWNYLVRLYRPRQAILDGSWSFPALEPLQAK